MTDQEINEAVARKLGWERQLWKVPGVKEQLLWKRGSEERPSAPNYCGNIAAAWEIVEKADSISLFTSGGSWQCHMDGEQAEADTAPMAICLAFLKL